MRLIGGVSLLTDNLYLSQIRKSGLLVIDPEDPSTIERVARQLAPYPAIGDSWKQWIYEAKGVLNVLRDA